MSAETSIWLNTKTLIGHTLKRGNAWHYRSEQQGDESNHYEGAIPVEDVRRRLFNWQAVEGTVVSEVITEDGVDTYRDVNRKTIIRPKGAFGEDDNGGILGVFKSGYQIHQFDEWLLTQVAAILDADLGIGSAGLLRAGAMAWVQVEMPESIVTPSGVEFRPNLLAATSRTWVTISSAWLSSLAKISVLGTVVRPGKISDVIRSLNVSSTVLI